MITQRMQAKHDTQPGCKHFLFQGQRSTRKGYYFAERDACHGSLECLTLSSVIISAVSSEFSGPGVSVDARPRYVDGCFRASSIYAQRFDDCQIHTQWQRASEDARPLSSEGYMPTEVGKLQLSVDVLLFSKKIHASQVRALSHQNHRVDAPQAVRKESLTTRPLIFLNR